MGKSLVSCFFWDTVYNTWTAQHISRRCRACHESKQRAKGVYADKNEWVGGDVVNYCEFLVVCHLCEAPTQWTNNNSNFFLYIISMQPLNKKLSYRRGTARWVVSVEILLIATQQCSTTSPEQIEVMKLEGYSGPMCSKHVHSTVTRASRFHCLIGVINKPTTVELCISPVYRRLAMAKFSKSTM